MAKVTRKFSVEELEEKYGLPWESAVHFERGDKHRWYTVCQVVFQADDELFWEVDYLEPATEIQEGQERWYSSYPNNMVTATQVRKQVVEKVVWVAVNE